MPPLTPPRILAIIPLARGEELTVGVSYRDRGNYHQTTHYLDLLRAGPKNSGMRFLIDRSALAQLRAILETVEAEMADFPPERDRPAPPPPIVPVTATDTDKFRAYEAARGRARRPQVD
jgi:hypothetical protein